MRAFLVTLVVSLAAGTAQAQTTFWADLDGSQEVPPVATDAGGWATFTLNADNTVTYLVQTHGLTGTACHIHDGGVGINGGIVVGLSGGPTVWSGTTRVFTAGEINDLFSRGLYVNVHSASNPGGEIRGQIEIRPDVFGSHLDGAQEVPPTGSGGTGVGSLIINPDLTVTFELDVSGLSGPATAAHIHRGSFGFNGGIVVNLGSGPPWSGTSGVLSQSDIEDIQNRGMYFNVHTGAFPGGEIRGQIIPSGTPYGAGCDGSAGTATLSSSGAPMAGGSITISIDGGLPSSAGLLIASLGAGASVSNGCPYLLGAPTSFITLPLDGSGSLDLTQTLPDFGFSFSVFFQFVGFDAGAPNGAFYTTNGLEFPFTDF